MFFNAKLLGICSWCQSSDATQLQHEWMLLKSIFYRIIEHIPTQGSWMIFQHELLKEIQQMLAQWAVRSCSYPENLHFSRYRITDYNLTCVDFFSPEIIRALKVLHTSLRKSLSSMESNMAKCSTSHLRKVVQRAKGNTNRCFRFSYPSTRHEIVPRWCLILVWRERNQIISFRHHWFPKKPKQHPHEAIQFYSQFHPAPSV